MDQNNVIECGGFYFIHNFDSGNLGHVERVPTELIAPSVVSQKSAPTETPEYEFNLWTRPDCAGTEFENGNRTWFYFGIQASEPNVLVRLNLINLNKQGKMYAQGMAPVTRTLPGKPQWERIRDRPIHNTDDNTFTLSFKYRTADNTKATTFFAFTYPFSFAELQIALNSIDMKMLPLPPPQSPDDIYYHRECLIYSLEGRRVDLLTISSHHGISTEREERLRNLFPEKQDRPFKFPSKKVIFVSARVHPGETPSSFVFNGFLNLLLNRNDTIAIQLRKHYVFKMIPFLNPDGVARGHYRTDTRGVNLNRVYLNPSLSLHPTVYASRALIRFYHYGCEKEDSFDDLKSYTSRSIQNVTESVEYLESKKKKGAGNKGGDYYRRGSDKGKSSTTIKQPSDNKRDSKDKVGGEAGALAEQVCDMSIRETSSQASQLSVKPREKPEEKPMLNDHTLRTCLGSNVHLSTSDELNFPGSGNPLRPLRDTLKNSISLLMGSTSSIGDSLVEKESRLSNVRMGWCSDCRGAVSRLEDSMPSIAGLGQPYSDFCARPSEHTYSSIDEYREYQKKMFDDVVEKKEAERSSTDNHTEREEGVIYFCTNCFKRYMLNENNEEILCDTVSAVSTAVSAGDSGSIRASPRPALPALPAASTGDALPPARPVKEDKPKHKGGKKKAPAAKPAPPPLVPLKEVDSGLYLYLDLHGHASKKGIFMYGNHFEDLESCVECMLLPRIMSLNNLHFHFSSCNFTERNMYLKDRRDGMSREGSGRVAVFKATGLVRCYTLECNYNTGRLVNVLPPAVRDGPQACQLSSSAPAPPKYTPHIFEETPSVTRKYIAPLLVRNSLKTPRPTISPNPSLLTKISNLETRFSRTSSKLSMSRTFSNLPMNKTFSNLPIDRTSSNLPMNSNRPQTTGGKIISDSANSSITEKTSVGQTSLKSPPQAGRRNFIRINSQIPYSNNVNSTAYIALKDKISIVRPRYCQNLNISLEFLEEINPMEVGRSLGASILDLTGQHPNSRIPCSEHRNLTAVRDWLRAHTKTMRPQLTAPRLRSKTASPTRVPLFARSKGKVTDERKENQYRRAEPPAPAPAPAPLAPLAPRAGADVVNMNLRLRTPLPASPSRARYLDAEPKKTLAAKRRNVLSIRKPNASKTHVGATRAGAGKARRAADDAAGSRGSLGKLAKRAFRGPRAPRPAPTHMPRAFASSSSEDVMDQHWEDVAGGTALSAAEVLAAAGRRRPFPNAPSPHLKKIRLKASL